MSGACAIYFILFSDWLFDVSNNSTVDSMLYKFHLRSASISTVFLCKLDTCSFIWPKINFNVFVKWLSQLFIKAVKYLNVGISYKLFLLHKEIIFSLQCFSFVSVYSWHIQEDFYDPHKHWWRWRFTEKRVHELSDPINGSHDR